LWRGGFEQAALFGAEVVELIDQPVNGAVGGGDVLLDAAPRSCPSD